MYFLENLKEHSCDYLFLWKADSNWTGGFALLRYLGTAEKKLWPWWAQLVAIMWSVHFLIKARPANPSGIQRNSYVGDAGGIVIHFSSSHERINQFLETTKSPLLVKIFEPTIIYFYSQIRFYFAEDHTTGGVRVVLEQYYKISVYMAHQ